MRADLGLIRNNEFVCDPFTIMRRDDVSDRMGVLVIKHRSRITGELQYLQIDPGAEMLGFVRVPVRERLLIERLGLAGFRVSPLEGSLSYLFHRCLFNQSRQEEEMLPADAVVEIISSTFESNGGSDNGGG